MSTLFIIIAAIGVAVVIVFLKYQKAVKVAVKGQEMLREMAFSYTTSRSEGKTIGEAEVAIYEQFSVPLPISYAGIFLVGERSIETADENPVLFEWLVIREMAFTVQFWHKFIRHPSTTYPIINETNRNLSITDFCHYLPNAISEAEVRGINPPQSLKEIAAKGKEMMTELANSKIYSEWCESLKVVEKSLF